MRSGATSTARDGLTDYVRRARHALSVWQKSGDEFRLIELSDAAAELAGRERSALLGSSVGDIVPAPARILRDLRHALHSGESVQHEMSYLDQRGRTRRLLVSYVKGDCETVIVNLHDLTPQRDVEERLRVSEARYRALVDAANEGFWLVSPSGATTFANGRVAHILGHPVAEIVGGSMLDFVDPRDRAAVARALECPRDMPEAFEARFRAVDERELLCLLSVSPVDNGDGPPATLCVLADMTKLQEERELRSVVERRFRRMVETANEGVWTGDAEGRTTFVNEKLASMLGVPAAEMLGRPASDFVVDKEKAAAVTRAMIDEGKPLEAEVRLRRADGGFVQVIASVSILRDDRGKSMGSMAMLADVTALRREHADLLESRERFAAVFEQAPVGMVFIAAGRLSRGRMLGANRAFRNMVGRTEEELVAHDLWSLTHPDDAAIERGLAHRLFAGESATYDLEKRYLRPDGSVRWARFRVSVLRDENGAPLYGLGVAVDITKQKEAGEAATAAADLARTAEERYALLFREAAEAILLVGLDGRVIDVNPAFASMARRPPAELIGRVASAVLPNGGEEPAPWEEGPREESVRATRRIETSDGASVRLNVVARVVPDADGAPAHWILQCIPQHATVTAIVGGLPPSDPLSYRERQVLGLLARGLDGPAIAERLGLAAETVRSYGQSAREKLGAETRTQAVALALAHGEITL